MKANKKKGVGTLKTENEEDTGDLILVSKDAEDLLDTESLVETFEEYETRVKPVLPKSSINKLPDPVSTIPSILYFNDYNQFMVGLISFSHTEFHSNFGRLGHIKFIIDSIEDADQIFKLFDNGYSKQNNAGEIQPDFVLKLSDTFKLSYLIPNASNPDWAVREKMRVTKKMEIHNGSMIITISQKNDGKEHN